MIILKENLKAISFIGSVLLGVMAHVTYRYLKNESEINWKKFFIKLILAFFVCFVISPFIQNNEMLNTYYPQVIAMLAFSWEKAIAWIENDFFPLVAKGIVKKTKSDE